jgi:hypothetical protein
MLKLALSDLRAISGNGQKVDASLAMYYCNDQRTSWLATHGI